MYKSPVTIIEKLTNQINTDIENNVLKTIHSYGIEVDKDELIKALAYDRDQYKKGCENGIQALAELVKKEIPGLNPLYIDYLALKANTTINSG